MKLLHNNRTAIIVLLVLAVAAGIYFEFFRSSKNNSALCAPDATFCSNQSANGLTDSKGNPWSTFVDVANGFEFSYPPKLEKKYISTAVWPPKMEVKTGAFECAVSKSENGRPETTSTRVIGTRSYCVSVESEGAAGSVYDDYIYTTQKDGKILSVNFSLRFPQCLNYDEPNQTACIDEQRSFNVDNLANRMIESVILHAK